MQGVYSEACRERQTPERINWIPKPEVLYLGAGAGWGNYFHLPGGQQGKGLSRKVGLWRRSGCWSGNHETFFAGHGEGYSHGDAGYSAAEWRCACAELRL